MSLSRTIPSRVDTFTAEWVKLDFMLFGKLKAIRLSARMSMDGMDKCWWCKEPFSDEDMVALSRPARKGANKTLCQGCAVQVDCAGGGA